MIRIVSYSPELERSHQLFANRHWEKVRRSAPEYIYWKFRGEPGRELKSFILAIDGNNNVVGQLGMIPVRAIVDYVECDAQWFCDLMVDENLRGSGIAYQLYQHALSYNKLNLGSDPSPAAFKSMTKYGFRSIKGPNKYIIPVDIGRTLSIKYSFFKILNGVSNPVIPFLNAIQKQKDTFRITNWENVLSRVKKERSKIPNGIVHDDTFFRWRANAFSHFYKEPIVYMSVANDDFFFFYLGSKNQLYCSEYALSSWSSFLTACGIMFGYAKQHQLKSVRITANNSKIEGFLNKILAIKVSHPTRIMMNGSDKSISYFDYNYYDSDENI